MTNPLLTDIRIRGWLALGALACSAPALSQGDERDQPLEEVVVTGSYLKSGFDTVRPLQIVTLNDAKVEGKTTIKDVAAGLVTNTGSILADETADSALGTAQFNLRGLGLSSTLVLVNGRRGGVSAATSGTGFQFLDLNQFPINMVERVEILTDGASALYGSEAVAGVSNLITRKGFDGIELSGNYQDAASNPFDEGVLGLAVGKTFNGGSFAAYASYLESQGADRSEFGFLQERILGNGDPTQSLTTSSQGQPGSFYMSELRGDGTYGIAPGSARIPDPDCEAAGNFIRGDLCRYSFADQESPLHSYERFQFFTEAELDYSDTVQLFGEASFSLNDTLGAAGPSFSRNISLTGNGDVPGSFLYVPAAHPFNFFTEADFIDGGSSAPVDVLCQCRPLGDDYNGRPDRNDGRTGLRPGSVSESNYYRTAVGATIELTPNWSTDLSFVYARNDRFTSSPYDWISSALQDAVIAGRFNPFGTAIVSPELVGKDGVSTAGNSQEVLDEISGPVERRSRAEQKVAEVLVRGEAFETRSGPVGIAAGVQLRREDYEADPGVLRAAAIGNFPDPEPRIAGSTDVYSIFGESVVPLGDKMELQLALRYEDFGGETGDTLDPKIAFRYQANELLGLRGSWGTSFQAPTVVQLNASSNSNPFLDIPTSANPATGAIECVDTGLANGVPVRQKGSPNLTPQEAENYTLGLVLNPTDKLTASVDFWNFDYTSLITSGEGPQAILDNDCSGDGIPNDPRITYRVDGVPLAITTNFRNTGSVKTSGVDLRWTYLTPFIAASDFTFGGEATYVSKFDIQEVSGDPVIEGAGSRNFGNPFSPVPQLRANLRFGVNAGIHSLGLIVRHIDEYANDQVEGAEIDALTTVDLHYELDISDWLSRFDVRESSIYFGVNNIADEDPPSLGVTDSGGGIRPGYDGLVHDIRGRLTFAGFTLGF